MASTSDILEKIRQTKAIMLKNMDGLLARGQKLEELKDKTDDLQEEAKLFAEEAHALQERAKSRYLGLTFILIGLSVAAIYTIIKGYSLPVIGLGMFAGGLAGYLVNVARDFVVSLFSPTTMIKRKIGIKPSKEENVDFDFDNANILTAFNRERSLSGAGAISMREALGSGGLEQTSKLRLERF